MLLRSVPSGLLRVAFIPLLTILFPIRSVLCAAESDQMTAWAESTALFRVRFLDLEGDAVIDRLANILGRTQIDCGGRQMFMPQQLLHLLDCASGLAAEFRAGAAQMPAPCMTVGMMAFTAIPFFPTSRART